MILWRLCRQPHADLNGEGARRFGGRWNRPGHPVVYLAEHPALAALEVRVHLDLPFALLPADYVLMQVVVPDGLIAEMTEPATDTVAIGTTWLSDAAGAAASDAGASEAAAAGAEGDCASAGAPVINARAPIRAARELVRLISSIFRQFLVGLAPVWLGSSR